MHTLNELRKLSSKIRTHLSPNMVLQLRCELNDIANRIDAEYESACVEAYNNGVASVQLTDLTEYVKLPKDADDKCIRVGDDMEVVGGRAGEHAPVEYLALTKDGWEVDGERPKSLRHYHEPNVEDMLWELLGKISPLMEDDEAVPIVADYAKKLRIIDYCGGQ